MGTIASPRRYDAVAPPRAPTEQSATACALALRLMGGCLPGFGEAVRLPFDSCPFNQSWDRRDWARIRRASTGHTLSAETAGDRVGRFNRSATAGERGAAWLQRPPVLCGRELRTYADPEQAQASARAHFPVPYPRGAAYLMGARRNGGHPPAQNG